MWRGVGVENQEVAALDLRGAANPMEVEETLPDMDVKEGFSLVKSMVRQQYRKGWRLLALWEGFGMDWATCKPFSACFARWVFKLSFGRPPVPEQSR